MSDNKKLFYTTVHFWFLPEDSDGSRMFKLKSCPIIAPKPRPWSMVNSNSDGKTTDLSLLSDGSSPNNSTGNTPDSAEALDSSESSSIDRKLLKDVKLKRGGMYYQVVDTTRFIFSLHTLLRNAAHASSCQYFRVLRMNEEICIQKILFILLLRWVKYFLRYLRRYPRFTCF